MTERRLPTDDDPFLTAAEVADMFRVDAKTVTNWANEGLMRGIRTPGGGKWLFRRSTVRMYLKGGDQ